MNKCFCSIIANTFCMLDKIGREGFGIFLIRPFMCNKAVERITIRAQGCSVGYQTLFTQILRTNVKY